MELQALYVLHERMLRQATGALPEAAACASRGASGRVARHAAAPAS